MESVFARESRCRVRPAVTMLETMAGAAALLALLAIVTPSLSEARRLSKEVRCISNLQRISDASAAYAAGHTNELLTPPHRRMGSFGSLGSAEWGGKSGIGEPLVGQDAIDSRWGTKLGRGPGTRGLNAMLYKGGFADYVSDAGPEVANWRNDTKLDLDVYRCPSDYGYTGHHSYAWKDSGLSSFDHYGNSYTVATHWVRFPSGQCRLLSNSHFLRPASEVPSPARTLSYMENCGKYSWRANYGADGCESLSGSLAPDVEAPVRGWHDNPWIFTAAFVDGHVQRTYTRGHLQPQPDIGRLPYDSADPDIYDYWHCGIIRGLDWQLDTLPALPVPTTFRCGTGDGVAVTLGWN